MKDNIEINTEALELVVNELESKLSDIKTIHDELNKKMSFLDGDNDIWKGRVQDKIHNYYLEISSKFPNTIEELNNYIVFLKNTIENYKNEEKGITKDILENQLDIN